MELPLLTERLDADRSNAIARAAEIVRGGGLVAFPTETVYGLGANALSAAAVEGIFQAKQRPHWDPLIVHVCDRTMLERVCLVPGTAEMLMAHFWPGPLTLLLPRTAAVPDAVTAGRSLVGVRMPAHPVALELIRQAGVPLAAPSANTFGHTSPTTAAHVLGDLDGRIDAVLDGGACAVGVESTVAGFSEQGILVYRPGAISLEDLNDCMWTRLRKEGSRGVIQIYQAGSEAAAGSALPSPGLDLKHYSPRAELILRRELRTKDVARSRQPLERSLDELVIKATTAKSVVGVMLPDGWYASCAQHVYRWGPWQDGELLARRLYAGLRQLDDLGATVIICPVPELPGIGDALRDRLEKAARKKT